MTPTLSYIVPIYNVAKYLPQCIDSILEQNLPENTFEIILVDDGSTDESGEIADEYATKHPSFIHVIHQKNGGLSNARNNGISIATGDFIQYVDSDDHLVHDTTNELLEQIKRDNLDILRFNYQNITEEGVPINPNKELRPFTNYDNTVCTGKEFLTNRLGLACYAVQFIIKRKLAQDALFTQGIFFEDTEWVARLLTNAQRVSSSNNICYNYLIRKGSITKNSSLEKQRKIIANQLYIIQALQQQSKTWNNKKWFNSMIAQTTVTYFDKISDTFYNERAKHIANWKQLGIKHLTLRMTTKSAKRKLLLIKFSPALYCHIRHKRKK